MIDFATLLEVHNLEVDVLVSPVQGVLPRVAAAVWTVQPARPGRQGLV